MEKIEEDYYKLDKKTYLKKYKGSWALRYPFKDENNNLIWSNVLYGGSITRLIGLGIMLILLLFLAWSYQHDINECREFLESQPGNMIDNIPFAIGNITLQDDSIKGEHSLPLSSPSSTT